MAKHAHIDIRYRKAAEADAEAIAQLHAESWRRHYRGAYQDSYLDGDIVSERLRVWRDRLSHPPANQFVTLAEAADQLLGFACAYGANDPKWGTLLDNIHVSSDRQSRGIGASLLSEVVAWCQTHYPSCGLYLWVLAQNQEAQKFYRRYGASDQGGELSEPPGGGQIHGRRYVWQTLPDLTHTPADVDR